MYIIIQFLTFPMTFCDYIYYKKQSGPIPAIFKKGLGGRGGKKRAGYYSHTRPPKADLFHLYYMLLIYVYYPI